MTDYTAEVESRLRERLHTIPAGVTECCQPCADIRAALEEIKRLREEVLKTQGTANSRDRGWAEETRLRKAAEAEVERLHEFAKNLLKVHEWRDDATADAILDAQRGGGE